MALIEIAFGFGGSSLGVLVLQFICGLLLLPYPDLDPTALIAPLNGPCWSLILEMKINIAFAIAFAWLSLRVVGAVAAACGLAIIGISHALGTLETGFLVSDYLGGVARVDFSFSGGVLISRLRCRISPPRIHWSIVLVTTAALLAIPKPVELRWLYDSVCVIVLFPLLILAGAQSEPLSPRLLWPDPSRRGRVLRAMCHPYAHTRFRACAGRIESGPVVPAHHVAVSCSRVCGRPCCGLAA